MNQSIIPPSEPLTPQTGLAGENPDVPASVILTVDDDEDQHELVRQLLRQHAYTVLEADSGAAALTVCRNQCPDLILMDIMMPGIDGITACEQIRALPGRAHVPILMLTALEDPDAIARSFTAGATDYITKPINPSVLRHRVAHLLRLARIEAQLRANEQKFREFIEQASDGFVMANPDGRIMEWNRAMEQITGLTRAEVIDRSVSDVLRIFSVYPPDRAPRNFQRYLDEARRRFDQANTSLENLNRELIIRRASGEQRVIHESAFLIRTEVGFRMGSVMRDVTERIQIEDALRASEERYRLIAENMTDSVWLVDANLKVQYVSPSAARARGYTVEEIKALPLDRQLAPASFEYVLSRLGQVMTPERLRQPDASLVETLEVEVNRKDGTTYWEEITASLIRDLNGQVIGLVGAGRNITARKQVEAALRRSEERHRLITENMTDAVWLMDLQFKTLYVSPAVERTLGYSAEEIKQLAARRCLLTPVSEEIFRRLIQIELTPDNLRQPDFAFSQTIELEYYRRSGLTQWSEVRLTLVRDEHGRPTSLLGVGRDITERKRAEEKVLQLNADLMQRARELAALNTAGRALAASLDVQQVLHTVVKETQVLLDAERSAVWLCDAAQDDLVVAAAAGDSSAALIGTRLPLAVGLVGWVAREGQAALINDVERDSRHDKRAEASAGQAARSLIAVPIEFRGVRLGVAEAINRRHGLFSNHDREMLEALASSAAIAIENARLYQVEREQLQRLQESQARLVHAEKMSALGRLVASLTHEINNPLQAIQSGLYVMHDGLESNVDRDLMRADLHIIEREVNRITDLMQRLREFSRPVRLHAQSTDLHQLLDNILDLVNKHLQQQHVTVTRDWVHALPALMLNPDLLTQVFMNLIFNAVDAMPEGGTLSLSTTLDRATDDTPGVRVNVSDTGSGMPPDVLKRIFEPFYTTKPNGLGLGLAISYEIVQSLAGEIDVTSQLEVGTTFSVRLPLPSAAG